MPCGGGRARRAGQEAGGAENRTEGVRKAAEEVEKERRLQRSTVRAQVNWSSTKVDPFDVFDLAPQRERGWEKGKRPTQRMLDVLQRAKIPNSDGISMGDAGRITQELKRRLVNGS